MTGRKPALRFIFITLFLDILGIGLIVPILPRRVLVFRPSQVLKAHVNHMTPPLGDDE